MQLESSSAAAAANCASANVRLESGGSGGGISVTTIPTTVTPTATTPTSARAALSTVDANCKVKSSVKPQRDLKKKILKQTLIIVMTFICCWTPYVFITTWYQIDWNSAKNVDLYFQNCFFLFAVSNSIINPFIYGKFVKDNPQRV